MAGNAFVVFPMFSCSLYASSGILDRKCSLGCLISFIGDLLSDLTSATVCSLQCGQLAQKEQLGAQQA